MAQLGRFLLRQCPILQNHYLCNCSFASFLSFPISLSPSLTSETSFRRRFSSTTVVLAAQRSAANSRSRRLGSPTSSPTQFDIRNDVADEEDDDEEDDDEEGSESEPEASKSRNELKREARRAVRWGMDLASFSIPQIKRILSVASPEKEVFEAINLVKKFGHDVREGKRRQFNYIGKLLRSADPELMDTLIRATKDGDHNTLQSLAGSKIKAVEDSDEDYEETDSDNEDEGTHINMATRWFEGLIGKDIEITNEVYSIRDVDFDRQELRKLVRRVHSALEKHENGTEENKKETESALVGCTKSLTRYLRALAKQLQNDM